MQQKELAQLVDISTAMVSRLVKRGMPTDSLERAERWRRRHLEPGRVKGSRFDTIKAPPPKPASAASPARHAVDVSDVETVGFLTDAALVQGNAYAAAVRTHQLRGLLANMGGCANPRLTVRVWVALLDYMIHPEAEIGKNSDMGELVTADGCGALFGPDSIWAAHVVIFEACDFDNTALNGWPDGIDDED